jgi:spermidine synthase
MSVDAKSSPDFLEQAPGPDGEVLTLRRAQGGFEILANDRVVQSSNVSRCEVELVNLGLVPLRDRHDNTILLAGLGMGRTLAALLQSPRVLRVDVVEHAGAIIDWNRGPLSVLHKEPPLGDTRVHVHQKTLADFLRDLRYQAIPGLTLEGGGYLGLLMDLDAGPLGLSRSENARHYTDEGLAELEEALRPGGVLTLWSGQREPELLSRLHSRFQNIAEIAVPVDAPGASGLDYIYRARRRATPGARPRAQA